MKNMVYALIAITLMIITSSCEKMMGDFLDKAPGIDVTEDTIFSSLTEAETFLASVYEYGIHSNLPFGGANSTVNNSYALTASATDEAESCAQWYEAQKWNTASVSPDNTDDTRWGTRWQAIRKITIFLDRIEDVPDAEASYIENLKGEVKFIRALNYFEMLKRYGGVPVIDHRILLSEDLNIPRRSVESVVNFILKDSEDAIAVLPSTYPSSLRGRITKGAALALKARTLLYAASPQFNTATPYLSFGANDSLICYGNSDDSRWLDAANAAKAVIDWAQGAGCHLITDQGVNKNYKYVWEVYDNPEIILANKSTGAKPRWGRPWNSICAPSIYPGSSGQNGTSPTFNFVKKYEKVDGNPQDWSLTGGVDLQAKMAELDPRFHQTIAYNMSYWNHNFPQIQIYQGGRDVNTCYGGFWLHKLYPEAIDNTNSSYAPNSTLFGLAEQYLNYAEALNEAQGPVSEAYDAVNTIRQRSGMPDLPTGLSKEDFRERVRNERAIELAFDDFRFWDVRRLLISENEGIGNGSMYGIRIYKIVGSVEFRYEPYVFETRTWLKKMYLHPFGTNEINKGYLIQNPGY